MPPISLVSDATTDQEKRRDEDNQQEILRRAGWKTLFAFTTKRHLPVFGALVLSAVVAGLTLPTMAILYGILFRQFADYASGRITGSILLRNASKYCTYMTAVAAGNWLANSIYFTAVLLFGELQAASARDRIFKALLEKDQEWYDTREHGIAAYLPAIRMHIRDLQLSTSVPLGECFQALVFGLGSLGVSFYFSWNLTLVIICAVPLVYVLMVVLSGRLSKRTYEQAAKLQEALKYVTNAVTSIETVKCCGGERFELQRYTEIIAKAGYLYGCQANLRSIQLGFMQFITFSIFVQGFWYGSYLVNAGKKDAGDVLTTFWGALMAVQGITDFLPQLIVLEKGKLAGSKLEALIWQASKLEKVSKSESNVSPDKCKGDVEFKEVSFAYSTRPNHLALRSASMFFPAGETTFVIGKSGSGKSTLGQLLIRFYEPASGHISIDGTPLKDLRSRWLRENITLVEQHSVLFNDTIRENIVMGKPGQHVTEDQVAQVIDFAILKEMMNNLPDGLDTMVGTGGNSLSGGQKQRVALARARLRDTPILILDESTSALDYITRSAILSEIRRWRTGRTTIVITHDISQIHPNDFVYVMESSRVLQEGYRKQIENEPNSALSGFVGSDNADEEPASPNGNDDTDAFLSLYEESWSSGPANPSRPNSATFFGEGLLSPVIIAGRSSMILSNRRRPSVPDLTPPSRPRSVASNRTSVHSKARPTQLDLRIPPSARLNSTRPNSMKRSRTLQESEEGQTDTAQSLTIRQILSTVWPALDWRSRMLLIFAFICAIIHAAATPVFAVFFAKLQSTLFYPLGSQHQALIYALTILAIAIVDGLAYYGHNFLFDYCAQTWINVLRKEGMERVLLQPREFFDREENSVSRLAECLDHGAEEARNLPGRFVGIVVVLIVMCIIAVIWGMLLSWKLTLVTLATGPILFAGTQCYNAISAYWERLSGLEDDNIGSVMHETFVNIKTVRCLVLEDVFRKRFRETVLTALRVGMKRAIYSGSIFGINYAAVFFVSAFLFWYGALLVSQRQFSVVDIIQVFGLLLLSVNHINFIANYIPQINLSRDGATKLIRLSRLPIDSHEHEGTVQLRSAGDIVFQDLFFAYPTRKAHTVLNGINLRIPRGSYTAIVGSSGSGKSTVTALLMKLYQTGSNGQHDFTNADLAISKHNIKTLHTSTLRSKMAIVSQTPFLFPGSIAENISYGLSESSQRASMEGIREAASAAGIAEFIDSLPLGYQTPVGEGGTGLSGGQAQRISIARALARKPNVLILDEATSALDVESAGIVRDTIQRLVAETKGKESGMTVIIITHAREMMAIAEHIVMLDKGRVVDEGSFDEMKKRNGPFARLLRGEAPDRGMW
ncbi:multidrug resistance protein 2 [Polyplosphaeria fusca]|uniref:Multidrug resistance protein 2 n=1 Tax=Polyplosphaeria fusca TaxID=682080 RepID=A0A9P4RB28_9PLEO|nr:multidrug resistance protein 2 [Polyplosphaeria fusca]